MRVTPLQTGTVSARIPPRVRRSFDNSRPPEILEPERWTDPIPIFAWLIEHPEGLLVVDTGESSAVNEPDYFQGDPASAMFLRQNFRFEVSPDDEIGAQLRIRGFDPDDVRWVALTHLHTDHAGGIGAFPRAEILVSKREFEKQLQRPRGANPRRWPKWFAPKLVEYDPPGLGPFAESFPITAAGDVQMVPTEGHSPGHAAVIAMDGPQAILFAGDASETQDDLVAGRIPGIVRSATQARSALEQIRQFGRETPTIYLPAHDVEGPVRLEKRRVIPN